MNTHSPLRQTSTDTNSSANQDPPSIITTSSKVPEPPTRNILLRHSHFNPIKTDSQQHQKNKTPPPLPRVSTTPKSRTSPPVSPDRNQIRQSKVMVERGRNGCFRFQVKCSCGNRKGMCMDVVFVFFVILIFCFFLMIGIGVSFLLIFSNFFR
ncbi:hypothetical protein Lser_V15G12708 [Lactuca serriola]